MGVIKSKMGTIGSKMGRKFEQKRKAKWVKKKENLVKAYTSCLPDIIHIMKHTRLIFCFCVLLSMQTKEHKTGQAWEQGGI